MKEYTQPIKNIFNMEKRLFKVAIALMLSSICACYDPSPNSIYLTNHTRRTLSVYTANGVHYNSPTVYPDTLLPLNLREVSDIPDSMLDIFSGISPYESKAPILSYGNKLLIKGDTLSIFIIDSDTLYRYGYEYIAEHNKILIRYDLSRKDLKSLDNQISYPPSTSMADMHMSPSYEEIMKWPTP